MNENKTYLLPERWSQWPYSCRRVNSKDSGLPPEETEGKGGQEPLGYLGKMHLTGSVGTHLKENRKATWSLRLLFSFFVCTLPTICCLMAISLLFERIYRYQSHDYAFSSVEKLLHSLGGDDYLGLFNRSLLETLQKAGFSEKFLDEIITPVMRVNYGQTTNINGFVGKSGLGIVNGH